jgi:NAD(P)-dependent dehydrogenase (short-subunit alcohol dehydrogenase family)
VTGAGNPAWRPAQAVVVGAGSGIGRSVAVEFAAHGIPVRALCRRPETFGAGADNDVIDVRRCDVTDQDELRRNLDGLGPDTVVVHTAASSTPAAPIWECDPSDAFASLSTMVASVWQTAHDCLKAMVAADSGLLLLASSGAATKIAAARATYSMGKAAVDQMVRVVGSELQIIGSNAGIAAFYPGMVDTAMQRSARADAARLQGTPFGQGLGSFTVDASSVLDPAKVADDIVGLAHRLPTDLNGAVWRLRGGEWSPV